MGVRRLRSSISISLLFHALFILACALLLGHEPPGRQPKLTWIEVDPARAPKPRAKPKAEEQLKRQIVQTERGRQVDKAAPDAFLGERTQVVDRQTVSKEHTTA